MKILIEVTYLYPHIARKVHVQLDSSLLGGVVAAWLCGIVGPIIDPLQLTQHSIIHAQLPMLMNMDRLQTPAAQYFIYVVLFSCNN